VQANVARIRLAPDKETLEAAEFEALIRSADGAGRNVA
jgi:hypothetical protein